MPIEKKKVALYLLFVLIAVSPLVLLSTWSIRKFENHAIRNLERPSSPRLLMRVAWVYKSSFRPEDAKRVYKSFYTLLPNHPEAIEAHWQYVLRVKNTESRAHTGAELQFFMQKWGGTPQYKPYESDVQRTFFYVKRL